MSGASRTFCLAMLSCLPCSLGLTVSPAAATRSPFGGYGAGAAQLDEPNGVAVDQQSGDVYVVDTNNERVDKFTADGTFLFAWGWGILDGKAQALQTCTKATGCHAGPVGPAGTQDLNARNGTDFRFAEGVAVDNNPDSASHGDVYVLDISNHRVEKFSPAGRFLLEFGRSVNETAHARGEAAAENVCPVRRGDRCTVGVAGPAPGQFEFPVEGNFIAVGPAGTVYVGDRDRVQEFGPNGVYRLAVALAPEPSGQGPEVGGVSRLAVDAGGDMYVVRIGVSGVRRYSPRGELLETLDEEGGPQGDEGPTPGIALDSSDGRVFLDVYENAQHRVLEYDSSGTELASFDAGMEDALHGIAYGDRAGELYLVATNGNARPPIAHVRILTPPRETTPVFSSFKILGWLRW
jgi:tripartite motif-containing protein 71